MAIVYMTSVNIIDYDPNITNKGWEYDTGDKAVAGNGDTIIMPITPNPKNVTLEITAGEGYIQTTKTKLANVLTDTDVIWDTWLLGSITTTAEDSYDGRVTAMRMVNVSGTTRMLINI